MVTISLPHKHLSDFCERWQVTELALFGSVLRPEVFGPDSDIDVLVTVSPDARHSLFDIVRMKNELTDILGRDVDLVSRRGLERSPNYLRRDAILGSAVTVYEA